MNIVLDAKQREVLEEKQRANRYLQSASIAQQEQHIKSIEADMWKQKYTTTERQKSIDTLVSRDIRNSSIHALQNSHNNEMLV